MTELKKLAAFLGPKFRQILHFAMKQGIASAGGMAYGLLCVRLLPKPEYAKFAVLFGFMGSLTLLLDIGVSSTLPPMVGEQTSNLRLIANCVASVRRIMQRLFLIVAPVAAVAFVLLVRKQQWGVWVVAQMLLVLLITAWFVRVSSTYGAVLILRRDRDRYYLVQIAGSLGSLTLLLIFAVTHGINIYVGILLNVAQVLFITGSYYLRALELLGGKGEPSAQQEKAIVRLALPNAPSILFYAFQGQITLMLITLLGHDVSSIANVGALMRLSQILVFVAQMNQVLVEPYFAKLPAPKLKRVYLLSFALVAMFAAAFACLGFLFPQIFLWPLGPKYSQLRVEVGLVVLSSAIQFIGGFLWVIHTARRFVYWWNNFAIIVLTLLVQAVFVWKVDLSTIKNVLILNVASVTVSTLVAICCGIYGFWRGPQKMERTVV